MCVRISLITKKLYNMQNPRILENVQKDSLYYIRTI